MKFDFDKMYDYENGFYLTCSQDRIAKLLAHYELYKKIIDLPGAVVECGVFKGASLIRFATFRNALENYFSRKIIGFDIFGEFPDTSFADDKPFRDRFISQAGSESLDVEELQGYLEQKNLAANVELIKGNIINTIPDYLKNNPHLKISLLHIDVDLYEPTKSSLECLVPLVVKGGVVILDDYNFFPGATKAIDDYFSGHEILKFPFSHTPSFVVMKERNI